MNRGDVLRLAQPPARRALPGLLAGLASAFGAVALLATSAWLITRASEQPPILFLGMAIVGVRAFALGRAAFRYLERITSHDAAFRALATLRVGVFERLLPFAPAGLRDTRRGDLLARLVGDVDRLQDLPLRVVQPLAVSVLVQAASVAVVGAVLPAAGIALAVVLAVSLAVGIGATTALAGRAETRIAPLRARLQDLVLDLVGGLDVLTAFGVVDDRLTAIDRAASDLRRAELRSAAAAGVTTGVVLAGTGAVAGWTVLQGVPGLASGTLDPAWLALAALVPLALVEQATAVPLAAQAWRSVRTSAERVAGVVPGTVPDEIPREPDDADAEPVPAASPAGTTLEVRDLVTRWPGADDDALAPVSLVVRPGRRSSCAARADPASRRSRAPSPDSSSRVAPTSWTAGTRGRWPRPPCAGSSASASRPRTSSTRASGRTCSSRAMARRTTSWSACSRGWASPGGRPSGAGSTRASATAAASSRAARRSGSPWRGRSSPTSRCSCSTSRRPTWTRIRPVPCCATCSRPHATAAAGCSCSRTRTSRATS